MAGFLRTLDTTNSASIPQVSSKDDRGELYTHGIETELLTSTPRQARLTPKTITTRRWLWNLLVGSFCLMVFLGQRGLDSWDALLQRGKMTPAIVTNKYTTTNKGTTTYYVGYAFTTAEGIVGNGSMTVDSIAYDTTSEGDSATVVTYLPGSNGGIWQEGVVTVERRVKRQWAWIFGTLLVTGLWGAILGGCEWEWRRQLSLLQNGIAVIGQVTEGKVTHGSKGETYYGLIYQYPVGTVMENRTVSVAKSVYDRYTQSNPYLTVLYDPQKPQVSRPYFLLGSALLDSRFA